MSVLKTKNRRVALKKLLLALQKELAMPHPAVNRVAALSHSIETLIRLVSSPNEEHK